MGEAKQLLYIGSDFKFVEELEERAKSLFGESSNIAIACSEIGHVIAPAIKSKAEILLIDFSSTWNLDALINEVKELRSNTSLPQVFICALWASEDQISKLGHLYAQGFQYGFVKGGELDYLISDLFRLRYEKKIDDQKYAKAIKIDKEMNISLGFSLGRFSREHFEVDGGISLLDDVIPVKLPMGDGYDIGPAQITSKRVEDHKDGHTLFHYELNYPFDDQWSDKDRPFDQRALTRWILNHTHELCDYRVHLCFATRNVDILTQVCNLKDKYHFSFDFVFKQLSEIDAAEAGVVFYDVENGERAHNSLEWLEVVLRKIKNAGGKLPIFVLGGCPSSSEALRKVLGYDRLISIQRPLTSMVIEQYLESVSAKFASRQNGFYCLRSSDPRRLVSVSQEIVITSMSEREISFLSDLELPVTTLIRFQLPTDFYLSIVETCEEATSRRAKKHYRGVIHSITEENLRLMRKFVNQMIYSPLKNFSRFEIDLLLSHKILEDEEKKEVRIEQQSNEAHYTCDKLNHSKESNLGSD